MSKIDLNHCSRKKLRKIRLENPIRKRFKNLNNDDKITIYTNPNHFSGMKLEKINPNHKGIIWGFRKRKYRKIKGKNWIKIAKIQFSEFALLLGTVVTDKIIYCIDYSIMFLNKVGFVALVFYTFMGLIYFGLCFKLGRY